MGMVNSAHDLLDEFGEPLRTMYIRYLGEYLAWNFPPIGKALIFELAHVPLWT